MDIAIFLISFLQAKLIKKRNILNPKSLFE